VPVSDVDRAKDFYKALGWRLDADFVISADFRVVQLTVDDIEAAQAELADHGADVSEVFHDADGVFHHAGTEGRAPGPNAEHSSYASFASFSDPDGNGWLLQEVRQRAPGR
jgi:catechol 2,3-dioxygenase-like lactoylglutathione lyase family enzyme